MPKNRRDEIWYWYHNVSEPYYHIQLTVKYRKALMNEKTEKVILEITKGIEERYGIEVSHVGFDKNHVHILCKFLPKYSGGQVIRLIKSITAREIFRQMPEIKKELDVLIKRVEALEKAKARPSGRPADATEPAEPSGARE